jgi:CheY-like chemotaxis protein
VRLADVMSQAVETVLPLAQAREIAFEVQHPDAEVCLDADLPRLVQVFANLLNNAVKFTQPSGRIVFSSEASETAATITVIDSGIGFSADASERIFEMFYQEDVNLERRTDGLGIGLTLARALVEMHEGTIHARSAGPGKGATFIVKLPLLHSPARRTATSRYTATASGEPPLRVLIGDDNADAADMLRTFVDSLGHETTVAHDGLSALEAVESFRPDVVLLDIGLPGISGYDVARAVRQRPDGGDICLAAVTGWGQDEDRRRTREAGFNHHLTKPVNPSAIVELLNVWRSQSADTQSPGRISARTREHDHNTPFPETF